MTSHNNLLKDMPGVRSALIDQYQWFIHTTPEENIKSISSTGLEARSDDIAPSEVQKMFNLKRVPILCLHPLGATICPKGACNNYILPIGSPDPKSVSLAVMGRNLPSRLGLDWSYEWRLISNRFKMYSQDSITEFTLRIANEFGSIVSYDNIPSQNLRIFNKGNAPDNPDTWMPLTDYKVL